MVLRAAPDDERRHMSDCLHCDEQKQSSQDRIRLDYSLLVLYL